MSKPGTVGRLLDRLAEYPRDAELFFHAGGLLDLRLLSVYPNPEPGAPPECHVDVGTEETDRARQAELLK